MAYNTGNPIGSKDPRDLSDNAENLDTAVNTTSDHTWTDRLGNTRKTWLAVEESAPIATAAADRAKQEADRAELAADLAMQGDKVVYAETLADLEEIEPEEDGIPGVVWNDPVEENNGYYVWDGAAWERSQLQPLQSPVPTSAISNYRSRNLFNPDAITDGVRIDAGGVLTPDEAFYTTDYIRVLPSTTYAFSTTGSAKYVGFYDQDKNYLSRNTGAGTITTPANTAYIRISPRYSETPVESFMVALGELPSSYEPYAGYALETMVNRNVPGGYAGLDPSGHASLSVIPQLPASKLIFVDSQNIFNPDTITPGIYIGPGGTPVSNAAFYTSDYMEVMPSTQYSWSNVGVAKRISWYDEEKNYLSGTALIGTATSPAAARFARVSPRYDETPVESFMFVAGPSVPSVYQPYAGYSIERQVNKGVPFGYAGLDRYGKIPSVLLPPITTNYWKGKKVVGLGDSITWGFTPRNDIADPNYPNGGTQLDSWLVLLAGALEMSYQNYGISGSTLAYHATRNPMCRRYTSMADDADLIIVMGGTNDFRNGIALGQFSDSTDATYYGALHVLCLGLIDKYYIQQGLEVGSRKQIMFMTPLKILDPNTGGLDTDIEPYCQAVKEVCAYYAIPVFDAYNESGITPHILRTVQGEAEGYTGMYNPLITDGTHPTQDGQRKFAGRVAGFVQQLAHFVT